MTWGAVAGGVIGAAGSYLGGKAAQPKVPKFTPYSITGSMFGDTVFDRKRQTVSLTPNDTMGGFADTYKGLADTYFGGNSPTQPFQNFAYNDIQSMLPGLFGGAMDASMVDPATYARYDAQVGQLGNAMAELGTSAAGMGMGMLGERPQSYDQVYQDRLGLLREAAAPFEQRAFSGMQQNLFNTGRLGTTGGSRNVEAFARGLGQADTTRQLDAMGFAEGLYGRDQNYALGRNQIGAGLFGQGSNMFTGAANIFGNQFNAGTAFNDIINARAQQRMQNAQGLFGFGTALTDRDLSIGSQGVQGYMGIGTALQNQAAFGGQLGGMNASAAPQPGGPSMMGGLLTGLGGAVSNMDLSRLFNSTPRGYTGITPGNYNVPNAPIPQNFDWIKPPPGIGG